MKFCPNCGNALQPGVKFCPACGMKIEAMQSVSDQPEAPETNGQSTKSNDLQATGLTDAATIQSTQSVTDAQPTQQVQTSQQTAYEQQAQFNQPRNNQRAQQAIPDQPNSGLWGVCSTCYNTPLSLTATYQKAGSRCFGGGIWACASSVSFWPLSRSLACCWISRFKSC